MVVEKEAIQVQKKNCAPFYQHKNGDSAGPLLIT